VRVHVIGLRPVGLRASAEQRQVVLTATACAGKDGDLVGAREGADGISRVASVDEPAHQLDGPHDKTKRSSAISHGRSRSPIHRLCRTCCVISAAASLLLQQGVPARVVMDVLGHSQISLTLGTYSHVVPELAEDAAKRMGEALWG
jgi:hypothetical protein